VQKSTGLIIAGNHRYRRAVAKGAQELDFIIADVDDATALRILLADNRTSDKGGYDKAKLAALLDKIQKDAKDEEERAKRLRGTAYTEDDVEQVMEKLRREAERAGSSLRTGSGVISYNLVFETDAQQKAWFAFLGYLKTAYPTATTIGARIVEHLRARVPEAKV
jgi:hypothetical protein